MATASIELARFLSRTFDDLAVMARGTDADGVANILIDASDFFRNLIGLGEDLDDAMDSIDDNAEWRAIVDNLTGIAAGVGFGIAFSAGAAGALAAIGVAGVPALAITAAGFLAGEAFSAFVGALQRSGLTLVSAHIDVSDSTDDLLLLGTVWSDTLLAGQGDDTVVGRAGGDILGDNGGSDYIDGGVGSDTISYGGVDRVTIDATDQQTVLVYNSGDVDNLSRVDVLNATGGSDALTIGGNLHLREVNLGGGNDTAAVTRTANGAQATAVIDGGSGTDLLTFLDLGWPVTANLTSGYVNYGMPGASGYAYTVTNFENVFGNDGRDNLTGNAQANLLDGADNNDVLKGEGGNDTLIGAGGSDSLDGGAGDDVLEGGDAADRMEGGTGYDTFIAGNGDRITDTDGSGTVQFNGITLGEGTRPPQDDEGDGCPVDYPPVNEGDEEEEYTGANGETYTRNGSTLTVTHGGATLTIENWSQGDLGITLRDEDKDPEEWTPPDCFASPLVFDLDGDGIEIIRLDNSFAFFDIDADGDAERTAWVSADDGILSFDLNGNGVIDGAQELFGYGETFSGGSGNHTLIEGFEDGGRLLGAGALDERYTSGFELLASYDLNLDGVIDANDTFYNSFRMWRDLNGNGISEAAELFTLSEVGVAEISLSALSGDREIEDSIITDTGSYVTESGETQEVSDVWFRFDQFDAQYDYSDVTPEIEALPNIQGTGAMPDLHVAMAADSRLMAMVQDVLAMDGSQLADFRSAVEAVLMRWAGIEDVSVYGRGASANGQRIALIEVLSDTPFMQWSGPDPRTSAGQLMDLQYEMILRDMMVRFAAVGQMGADLIPQIAFNNEAFIDVDAGTSSADMLDAVFADVPAEWDAAFAHIQAGVMMLDRVYMSFTDVAAAGDDGAAYRAEVVARLSAAGFAGITYDTLVQANMGTDGDDSMISPSIFGFQFFIPTEVMLTGAGDDEIKWGNKNEILLWGEGQGNDEIDADIFFGPNPFGIDRNVVRMQGLTRDDVTIGRGDGPIGNDVVVTIIATGETLTFRNMLLADNSGGAALEFSDGERLDFSDLEALFAELAETGSDGDDTLYQRQGTVLDGGAGDDALMGGRESTTYVYDIGYGNDEIIEDTGSGGANTLQFGPGVTPADLWFDRPTIGNRYDLEISIISTGETLTIYNQFANTDFIIDTFVFDDGTLFTADDILFGMIWDSDEDDRLVGSGREEQFGTFGSVGNDTFQGLGGDDTYYWGPDSGQDVVEDYGYGRYDSTRSTAYYQEQYVDKDRGDLVQIGYAFDELTVSRAGARFTFAHEESGAQLIVDNMRGVVERYTFAGDSYVYTLPEIMDLIDGNVDPETGSEDDDLLEGDDNGNNISGGDGNDTLLGYGGPDTLSGDAGDDLIDGGDRSETPSSYRDNNTLVGGLGDDTILGGFEDDILEGGEGADYLQGSYGSDTYTGGLGEDTIEAQGGMFVWNLGDGNDLVLGAGSLTAQFGAGIRPEDISYSIVWQDIAGVSDYYAFQRDAMWALQLDMGNGEVLHLVGDNSGINFTNVTDLEFLETGDVISVQSIFDALYTPSDDDQIFVGSRSSDLFAPGGGTDYIYFDSAGGTDSVSIGLDDGVNEVWGQLDVLAFEAEVASGEVTITREGALFEDIRFTLTDGTTLLVNNAIWANQLYSGTEIEQGEWLGTVYFGDGTSLTLADILAESATTSAGDDLSTGDVLDNDFAQTAGDDTLRGSGGSDGYHFGAGAGADVIVETAQGYSYSPDNYEFTFYDLRQLEELDTVYFGADITLDDLELTRAGDGQTDLLISIIGSSDSLLIEDQFNPQGNWGVNERTGEFLTLEAWQALNADYDLFGGGLGGPRPLPLPGGGGTEGSWGDDPLFAAGVERFVFADGTELTRDELEALMDPPDNSGDDVLASGDNGGVLDGGLGDDTLMGGAGDDFYQFDAGYGSDSAVDAGGTDTLDFGTLNRGALTLTRTGPDLTDLLIEVGGGSRNALYVEGQFAGDEREIEVFTFDDGTTLTAAEIRQALLVRSISNGNDSITGFESSDLIDARDGDDTIELRGGNDIVDGGEGFDVVVLRGPRSDYAVEIEEGRIIVTDLSGTDGVNRLYNVERLVFAEDPVEGGETVIELAENLAPIAGPVGFTLTEDSSIMIYAADLLAGASDPDGSSLSLVSVGAASGGLIETAGDGVWRFTPAADFNGSVSFDYQVEDAGGLRATGTGTITVTAVNDAPVIGTQFGDVEVSEDTTINLTIPTDAFADIDGDSLALSLTLNNGAALPEWLSFDGAVLSGTPPQEFSGSFELALTASDGVESVSQYFSLQIVSANDAPEAIGSLDDAELAEGDALAITLEASSLFADVDGDELQLDVTLADGSDLPFWLDFNPLTGVLSGVAPSGASGTLSLLVTASDGLAEASLGFDLSVVEANSAPELAMPLADVTVDEDSAVSFAIPAGSFTDVDGDTLTLTATQADGTALPVWLSFDGTSFTGQPPADWNGDISIQVTASDGTATATDSFTLTIAPVNDAPVLASALADQQFDEDSAVSFAIPAGSFTDVDGDALTLTATQADGSALPAWLSFDGTSFIGQPPADWNGDLSIEVTASDGTATATDSFTLTIAPVNDAPVAADDSGFEAESGSELVIEAASLLLNDSDVDSATLTVTGVSNGAGGTAVLNPDGSVTFTADSDFTGTASFAYTVSDGAATAQAQVFIEVESGTPTDPYADWWVGTEGRDWMFGDFCDDNQIYGAGGNDYLLGGRTGDRLHGGAGNDRLFGLLGDDELAGQDGRDSLYGSHGDDTLIGGAGNDRMWGGSGQDVFVFGEGDGRDRIHDFTAHEDDHHGRGHGNWHIFGRGHHGPRGHHSEQSDVIELNIEGVGSFDALMDLADYSRGRVSFDFGGGDVLVLESTRLSDLSEADFIFV